MHFESRLHFLAAPVRRLMKPMLGRSLIAFALLVLIAASIGMAVAAVERSPAFLTQPSARAYLVEPVLALVAYACAVVVIVMRRGAAWEAELKSAAVFGGVAGLIEIVNIAIENGIPFAVQGPQLQITAMLILFAVWGMAGAWTTRELGTIRSGMLASVLSAGVSMVIGVTAGFALQFFIAPPQPGYVATWAEFKRSGWSDAGAFGIANTLDSGFNHLVIAPMVGIAVGSLGAWIGRFSLSRRDAARRAGDAGKFKR